VDLFLRGKSNELEGRLREEMKAAALVQDFEKAAKLRDRLRAVEGQGHAAATHARRDAARESAAVLGFSSAIAAYGAFYIPKSFGTSIALTGGPEAAVYIFLVFYASCLALTWWYYARKQAEMPC
jgi:NNP family nitrate/nitrite transporter-like MFS transporter